MRGDIPDIEFGGSSYSVDEDDSKSTADSHDDDISSVGSVDVTSSSPMGQAGNGCDVMDEDDNAITLSNTSNSLAPGSLPLMAS
jgi:hypothetical protein